MKKGKIEIKKPAAGRTGRGCAKRNGIVTMDFTMTGMLYSFRRVITCHSGELMVEELRVDHLQGFLAVNPVRSLVNMGDLALFTRFTRAVRNVRKVDRGASGACSVSGCSTVFRPWRSLKSVNSLKTREREGFNPR